MLRRREELKTEIASLEGEMKQRSGEAMIRVTKSLYPGVDVRIGTFRIKITEVVKGPLKLMADHTTEAVVIEHG
jgi:hypothetical protein